MNEDVIADLKQFITATLSQQTAELRSDLRSDLAELEHKLSAKIDDLQVFFSESLTASNDAVHEQLKDHEHRITALEHAAA